MPIDPTTDPRPEPAAGEDPVAAALDSLDRAAGGREHRQPIGFADFLRELQARPTVVMRNIFQVMHDMIKSYVGEGVDEYPDDPESIHFVYYDCNRLFVQEVDHPFFADRLFANRMVNLAESMKRGAQQNKIYIFRGPPGCGKSTFLTNLLKKFEVYTATEGGLRYEVVWRFDRRRFGAAAGEAGHPLVERLARIIDNIERCETGAGREEDGRWTAGGTEEGAVVDERFFEIPCPSHDNPLLLIPKAHRRAFFDDLFRNDRFKFRLATEKEYEWVFKDMPCTFCSSLYDALLDRLKRPQQVFECLFARPYRFNRRIGEGISVFNPGDKPLRQQAVGNPQLQHQLNRILKDSHSVRYLFSHYARTNNGVYALMDIKSHNAERLIELHNIISEGLHKVEDVEENVNSLLVAVMNPEDQKNIEGFQSFLDRVEYITIPYVMDLNTEVEIYRNVFGRHIDDRFLPRVLHNFARVIISSRLKRRSETMLEWIPDPEKYRLYCDENLQLLKMEIYTGHIPKWLLEEDRKRLNAKRRRRIIAESESEGDFGISGRDSLKIFNDLVSSYAKEDKLINMSDLCKFFSKIHPDVRELIPQGLLDSLLRMYDYTVLQEVKESLYYYNEEQIARDIQNYLFAINFEVGTSVVCTYTGDRLEVTEEFLAGIEYRLLGTAATRFQRLELRKQIQREYTARTLTQEMMVEGLTIRQTEVFQDLRERYIHNLKEKVLDPLLENENFRRAIKEFDEKGFKTYDKKIKGDVRSLIANLGKKYRYTEKGAKEVCIYVIDNDLAKKFANP
ncbi:MAG: serine protein kinase PrkA [Desulfobacterales bacterium]|jgi:predicted Ser/Thr protein kinase|nr:serine protein kinase PrkA [Desulfobacterales bacterium]